MLGPRADPWPVTDPGLHAQALRGRQAAPQKEIDRRIAARLHRQQRLTSEKDPLQLVAVVSAYDLMCRGVYGLTCRCLPIMPW